MPSASRPGWRRSFAKRPSAGTSWSTCCGNWISARRRPSPASCGSTVLTGLRYIPQATARHGRSAGGLVPHLVAVGKIRQSARAAGSADGLAGRRHQGFDQGFDWPAAARSEVWRRCRARSRATRQAVDPAAGCQAGGNQAGRAPAAGRRFPAGPGAAGPWAAAAAGSRSAPRDRLEEAGVRGSRGAARREHR